VADDKYRELMIPFLHELHDSNPQGAYYSLNDLSRTLGFKVGERLMYNLDGIVLQKKHSETKFNSFLINKHNVWALAPFPKPRSAGKEYYCPIDVISTINSLLCPDCLGDEDKDYELKIAADVEQSYNRMQDPDAKFIRAVENGQGIKVCIPDVTRLAITRNICITRDGLVDILTRADGQIDKKQLARFRDDKQALDRIAEQRNLTTFTYNGVTHYYPEIFNTMPKIAHQVMKHLKFDYFKPKIRSSQSLQIAVIKKIPLPYAEPETDKYYKITTTNFENRPVARGVRIGVYGKPVEFQNGALEFFGKRSFYRYAEMGTDVSVEYVTGSWKEHMRTVDIPVLCESAYHRYEDGFFGQEWKGPVVFLLTKAHIYGNQSRYPNPYKMEEKEGTQKRVVNKFNCIQMMNELIEKW